ncbi:unnamed protein product [Linum tenue]|uniref:Uncharacterized protein n=1 Tax=Linum tenue TaxID=586396 RepID=A0AAV0QFQ0_9ROSI|nr:unnamed protein product [Linum tenue]
MTWMSCLNLMKSLETMRILLRGVDLPLPLELCVLILL